MEFWGGEKYIALHELRDRWRRLKYGIEKNHQ